MSGGESWLVGLGIETIGLVAAPTCPQMPPVYQVSVEGGSVRTRFVVECSSMFSGFVPPLSTYVFMYRCIDPCMHAAYTCISVYMYMCINIRTYIYRALIAQVSMLVVALLLLRTLHVTSLTLTRRYSEERRQKP